MFWTCRVPRRYRCLVCLKTRIDKYHDVRSPRIRQVRLPSCVPLPSPRRRWSHQVPLRTNMNDYRRKNGIGKSENPKYHDTDDMNVYGNSCNDKHVPLPSPRSREPLLSTLERARTPTSSTLHRTITVPFRKGTLRRYNLETTSVNECLLCLRCSCLHHVQIVTRFLVANSWDTRNPGAPHHLLHASTHFSFAPVSP